MGLKREVGGRNIVNSSFENCRNGRREKEHKRIVHLFEQFGK
jgi:hypothetical protein